MPITNNQEILEAHLKEIKSILREMQAIFLRISTSNQNQTGE